MVGHCGDAVGHLVNHVNAPAAECPASNKAYETLSLQEKPEAFTGGQSTTRHDATSGREQSRHHHKATCVITWPCLCEAQ